MAYREMYVAVNGPIPEGLSALAKLTSEQVADIRSRHAAGGVSFAALGREFGVSGRMASYIVHGRSWSSEM